MASLTSASAFPGPVSSSAAFALINITVDDSFPDPYTGNRIVYTQHWNIGQNCSGCWARVDKVKTFRNSWHDTTFDVGSVDRTSSNATFNFTGTAIYVYGILCNTVKQHVVTTSFACFSVDDMPSGNLSYVPDGVGNYTYNQLLFSIDSLPYGPHTLKIQNGGASGVNSLLLLDYLIYTSQGLPLDKAPSTPSPASSSVLYSPPSQPTASFLVDGPHDSFALTISIILNILLVTLVAVGIIRLYVLGRRKARTLERTSTASKIATRPSTDLGTIASLPPLEQRMSRLSEYHIPSTDATLVSNICVVQANADDESLSSTGGALSMARRTEKWRRFIYGDIRSP